MTNKQVVCIWTKDFETGPTLVSKIFDSVEEYRDWTKTEKPVDAKVFTGACIEEVTDLGD